MVAGPTSNARTVVRSPLDTAGLSACFGEAESVIRRDVAEARGSGLRGRPTFLTGILEDQKTFRALRRVSGAVPFDTMAPMLDAVIDSARQKTAAR